MNASTASLGVCGEAAFLVQMCMKMSGWHDSVELDNVFKIARTFSGKLKKRCEFGAARLAHQTRGGGWLVRNA